MRKVKFKEFIRLIYIAADGSEHDTYGKASTVNRNTGGTLVNPKIKEGTGVFSDFINDGVFHAWSTEGDNSEMSAVGIIEKEDGTVITIEANNIKFIDK